MLQLSVFVKSKPKGSEESYLARVYRELSEHNCTIITNLVTPCAITGMGEVGKTYLALAYANRYKDLYSVVYWLCSETEESLLNGYKNLLTDLNVLINVRESKERRACAVFPNFCALME